MTKKNMTNQEVIDLAYARYRVLGSNVAFDKRALVEDGDEGKWVQAMLYVPNDGKPDPTMRLLRGARELLAACEYVHGFLGSEYPELTLKKRLDDAIEGAT